MKALYKLICSAILLTFPFLSHTQIIENGKILHGNEWIDFDKTYYKIQVAEDGIYRISKDVLEEAGVPINENPVAELSIFHLGKEIPIRTSSEAIMGESDFIEFYGKKNRDELDKWMFTKPEFQINKNYSLITDTTAYFLSFGNNNPIRYEEVNTDLEGNTLSPEVYYPETILQEYHNTYVRSGNSSGYKSSYDNIIGFSRGYLKALTFSNIPISEVYENGPKAKLNLRFLTNNTSQDIECLFNNKKIKSYEYEGVLNIDEDVDVELENLSAKSKIVLQSNLAAGRVNVSQFELTYPRLFDFANATYKYFEMEKSSSTRYLEVKSNSNSSPWIYDIENNQVINPIVEEKVIKFLIAPTQNTGRYILVRNEGIKTITSLEKVNFIDYGIRGNDLLFITNKKLAIDDDGTDVMEEYKQYRETVEGGNFSPIIVDIDQLYNQFSHGIHRHPYSVKNFINSIHGKWKSLKYVYIVGAGIQSNSSRVKYMDKVFVPTYGYPPSDNLLTSLWDEDVAAYSIGRIAVQNASELDAYLQKVKDVESNVLTTHSIENKEWMKKILHLSGGGVNEHAQIRHELKVMEGIIEKSQFGADVTTFYKVNSDPVDNSVAQYISKLIHGGLSMITFFGHSAPGTFDINLEDIDNYNNAPKFPVLLSFGCYSGNIHLGSYTLAGDYVLKPNKGMSAFIGSSWNAYVGSLSSYGKSFYKIYGQSNTGNRLGDVTREALKLSFSKSFRELLTLHGDPCLGLYAFDASDYTPDYKSTSVIPESIDAYNESFEFCTDIVNLGKNQDSTLEVSIKHYNKNDELVTDTLILVAAPNNRINYCFELPLYGEKVVGLNRIKIELDPNNLINELPAPDAEMNNTFKTVTSDNKYEFYIIDNSAMPVKPKNFSIVPNDSIMLVANTTNAFSNSQDFIIEIDTLIAFNSTFKKSKVVEQKNGTITWTPEIKWQENTEYFWRISPKMYSGEAPRWNYASFVHLPNSERGFNQSDHGQFIGNHVNNMIATDKGLEFTENFRDFRIYNRVRQGNDEPHFYVNGTYYKNCYFWPTNPSFAVVVIDTVARFSLVNNGGSTYGSENPFGNGGLAFYFTPNTQQSRIDLVNFLKDTIADTDYVFFYSKHKYLTDDFHTEEWALDSLENDGHNLFNYLKSQGATKFDYFRDSTIVPYTFVYQKNKGVHMEDIAPNINESIDGTVSIKGRWRKGSIKSPVIGPVTNWSHVEWAVEPETVTAADKTWLSIYGIKEDGTTIELVSKSTEKYFNLKDLVNADTIPYLQLEYHARDNQKLTPANLDYWRVYFDGQLELIIDTESGYEFHQDTLQQGDEFKLVIPVRNISIYDAQDSLDLLITLKNDENQILEFKRKIKPLKAGQLKVLEFIHPTIEFLGDYDVTVDLNPDQKPLECFYFNNFGIKKFNIKSDIRNPLLNVTFDGRRIIDGDIISPTPIINIDLEDENKYLLLNDTSAYDIKIVYPDGKIWDINFNDPRINFIPATSQEKNLAKVTIEPDFEMDGDYKLVINARDRSDNKSGKYDYQVHFKIINEQMISNVFNYPNPFSTSTQFIFTLTGREIPSNFKIQIMTTSGKVVREILKEELGELNIGLNRTKYKWDGTDEFGNPLANGVYLYRVHTVTSKGESLKKYQTNTEQYFRNNIGKLVITR